MGFINILRSLGFLLLAVLGCLPVYAGLFLYGMNVNEDTETYVWGVGFTFIGFIWIGFVGLWAWIRFNVTHEKAHPFRLILDSFLS